MITEIAQIDIKPGSEKDFEAAVAKARAAFGSSKGFHGFELHRSIEKPQRYRLMVKWETLENHTVDFRGSEQFHPMARAGRAVFCLAARGRTYRDGAHLDAGLKAAVESGDSLLGLEMIDHDLGDCHQRQRQGQAPDAEHDAQQDLESE